MGRARLILSKELIESLVKEGTPKHQIKANALPKDAKLVFVTVSRDRVNLIFESPSFSNPDGNVAILPPIEVE